MTTQSKQSAMTTLEVLCATLLATLLMTAVLGIVSGITKHEKTLATRAPQADWIGRLERLLRDDFSRADQIELRQDRFVLTGPMGRDPVSGVANWRPAKITYQLTPLSGSSKKRSKGVMLVRSSNQDALLSTTRDWEIVCWSIDTIAILGTAYEERNPQLPLAETGVVLTDLRSGPLPARLQVVLFSQGRREPIMQCKIVRP